MRSVVGKVAYFAVFLAVREGGSDNRQKKELAGNRYRVLQYTGSSIITMMVLRRNQGAFCLF
jgi:hypothetical protein